MEQSKINPYFMVVLGVVAVSFSSLFVKLSEAHPFIIGFYRLIFTFLILLPMAWRDKVRDLGQVSLRDFLLAVLSGVFLALHFITWFTSLKYTSVASSVVLVTTQPIFVVGISFFLFREKIGAKALVGGAIALLGGLLIGATDFQYGGRALWGDILALIGAVMVSGYLIIGRRLRLRMSLALYTFLAYGSSSLVLALVAGFTGQSFYPYGLQQWLLFLALAVICTVLGHTVFNWALKYVQASVIAIGVLGEPLGAIIWAAVFLGENPTGRQLVSGAVILIGLFIFIRASGQQEPEFYPE